MQMTSRSIRAISRMADRARVCRIGAVCVLAVLLGLASCTKKEGPARVAPLTPLQARINTDSTLSFFHRLIIQANETGLLANNSVTLLIPTNAAFLAAGYSEKLIDSLPSSQADLLVKYLFIPSTVNIPVADSSVYTPYATLLGNPVFGMSDGHRVWFNGASAILDTAKTGQALIYRLDQILPSSADSLNHFLDGDSTLSIFAQAFQITGLYDSLLASGSSYTILAPSNAAFQAAGYDSVQQIDTPYLFRLVKYHTVNGIWFTNTLATQNMLTTQEGGTIAVSLQNGTLRFLGKNNSIPAMLLTSDQVAGKTIVVQRIDQLLLP